MERTSPGRLTVVAAVFAGGLATDPGAVLGWFGYVGAALLILAGFGGVLSLAFFGALLLRAAFHRLPDLPSFPIQRRRSARRITPLTIAAMLLPAEIRDEHFEEWLRWLEDLQESGASWRTTWIEIFSIIGSVPRLALIAWRAGRRAVE